MGGASDRQGDSGVSGLANLVGTAAALTLTAPAIAQDAGDGAARWIQIEGLYKGDAVAVVRGGLDRGARLLGNGELVADADFGQFGWTGARAKLHLLSVHGGDPNDLAGTMQGVNNIEALPDRTKIYQVWLEQSFAGDRAALLVGMADLNADFYQNDAAGLLIAPAFGIGSELAATGPNGPSIFPSTALAARLRVNPEEAYMPRRRCSTPRPARSATVAASTSRCATAPC